MARPAHTLHVLSGVFGTVGAPLEDWQMTVRTVGTNPTSDVALEAERLRVANAFATYVLPYLSDEHVWTNIRTVHVTSAGVFGRNPDGSYQDAQQTYNAAGSQVHDVNWPTQLATVISFTSARADASGKGRVFMPFAALAGQVGEDRLLSVAYVELLAGAWKSFLEAASSATETPAVVSSKGYASIITGVRVGRVVDTQRSRREDRDEGYVALPVDPF